MNTAREYPNFYEGRDIWVCFTDELRDNGGLYTLDRVNPHKFGRYQVLLLRENMSKRPIRETVYKSHVKQCLNNYRKFKIIKIVKHSDQHDECFVSR